jgi:phosphoadenylyl-sulfate reductase (thioredoxin)
MQLLDRAETEEGFATLEDIDVVLAERSNGVTLRVPGETEFRLLEDYAPRVERIVVTFKAFRDGRGLTLATRLRERGYTGRLEAEGDVLPDQAIHLSRCGFDAVRLGETAVRAEWERALQAFSAVYQPATDGAPTVWALRARRLQSVPPSGGGDTLEAKAKALNEELRDGDAATILKRTLEAFPGRVAVLSSFGAEAAVPLHLVAQTAPDTPVLFLDTDRHFGQTLPYRDELASRFGLTDVRSLKPENAQAADPKGDLWRTDADLCCTLRKVKPLAAVKPQFDVLITGRKRFHGAGRMRLPLFEVLDGQIRLNLLANWSPAEVEAYFETHALPRHPLVQAGYRSIGCWPCTQPSADAAEDVRAGRWAGSEKVECGIHLPAAWAAETERRIAS